MLVRSWKGATRVRDAEAYERYLLETGISDYRRTPGNLGVLALRRLPGDGRAEFQLLSFWASPEAERSFAGVDPARAMFYGGDDRYLVERDESVDHYDAFFTRWPGEASVPPGGRRGRRIGELLRPLPGAQGLVRLR